MECHSSSALLVNWQLASWPENQPARLPLSDHIARGKRGDSRSGAAKKSDYMDAGGRTTQEPSLSTRTAEPRGTLTAARRHGEESRTPNSRFEFVLLRRVAVSP